MKLAVVGTGYVGLVAGVCFAEAGNDVTCVDVNQEKLSRLRSGELPIYEPGLERLFERNLREERLIFTDDLPSAVQSSDLIFLALPTPQGADGAADLSFVLRASEDIGRALNGYKVIVTKSTVPVGTADAVRASVARHTDEPFDVVSNPEFLREGVAVEDFLKPERVVIGTDSPRARALMEELYHPFLLSGNPLLVMDARSAEITKYAANAMLALRISFMNDIANLCAACGANVDMVRLGVGLDSRIGKRFLFAGIGYGGSCFEAGETVYVERDGEVRAQRFEALFAASGQAYQDKSVQVATPHNARVPAFDLESGAPVFARVQAVTRRPYRGTMVRLQTSMGRRLCVTAEHPVILDSAQGMQTVPAFLVQPGDRILAMGALPDTPAPPDSLHLIELLHGSDLERDVYVCPRDDAFTRAYDEFKAHIPPHVLRYPHEIKRHNRMPLRLFRHLRAQGVLQVPEENLLLYTAKGAATKIAAVLPLDADLMRLCGYYLAEGHISRETGRADSVRERIGFCFHANESEYSEDVRRILTRWGLKFLSATRPNVSTTVVSSRLFAWLLRDVLGCGTRSEDKALPVWAFAVPSELRFELLRGAWSGDGSVTPLQKGRNLMLEYATVSKPLADGMALLLQSLGIVPSIRIRRMSKSTQDAFILRVAGRTQIEAMQHVFGNKRHAQIRAILDGYQKRTGQSGFRKSGPHFSLSVLSTQREMVDTFVYSLETETGTLVASSGLMCHNCFPKDVQALVATGREHGAPQRLLEATEAINQDQKRILMPRILEHFDNDLSGRKFALWGLSFKPNTDDMREAPALTLIEELLSRGASIRAYDPEASDAAQKIVGDKIEFARRHYDACDGADALIIATEWNKFREPDFHFLKELLKTPTIFDGRNVYGLETMRTHGFTYYSIGRPDVRS